MEKKKVKLFSAIALVALALLVVGATYAYFQNQYGAASNANVKVTTYTTDMLTFETGSNISITAGQDDFASGKGNKTGQTFARATLQANNKTNTATANYNVYLNIENNTFTYTNTGTPELLLQVINKTTGTPITSITGLVYKTVTDGKNTSISGFDITNKSGLITILNNKEISAYIPLDVLKQKPEFLTKINKYSYDIKKTIIALKKIGIDSTNYTFDTMIAAYLLNYNVKDDIAYVSNAYNYSVKFLETLYKEKNFDINSISKECVIKAKFIYETKDKFINKLTEEDCISLFKDIEMPLTNVLIDMELTGMKVDINVLKNMEEELSIKIELLKKDIFNMAGCEFNLNSPKQLGEILFDKLGVPANKKRTTEKEHLTKYSDKFPIINKILEYKMMNKIYTSYVIGLQDYILDDSRIHTIYNQTLTRTGRLSSSYPNLQNIPTRYEYAKLVRKAFIPINDLFISSDYSQIELRIFAHLSKVPNLVEAFNSGKDIHTKTAMDIFSVNENEVNSEMRRQAKAVNFGILYGISGFGLSENLDMRIEDGQRFIKKYMDTFPGIKDYMDKEIKEAHECGYVKTIMNRKRTIDELNNKNYIIRQSGERIALNTPIQGSSADIIKLAMIEIHKKLNEEHFKSKMVLQIHDELVFDVCIDEKEKLEQLVKDIMENCYKLDVPLVVEMSSGKNWYEAK